MTKHHKVIYLQTWDDEEEKRVKPEFDEVTWCTDNITGLDTPYILKDYFDEVFEKLDRLSEQCNKLPEHVIDHFEDASVIDDSISIVAEYKNEGFLHTDTYSLTILKDLLAVIHGSPLSDQFEDLGYLDDAKKLLKSKGL
jgi:hypothetical protein